MSRDYLELSICLLIIYLSVSLLLTSKQQQRFEAFESLTRLSDPLFICFSFFYIDRQPIYLISNFFFRKHHSPCGKDRRLQEAAAVLCVQHPKGNKKNIYTNWQASLIQGKKSNELAKKAIVQPLCLRKLESREPEEGHWYSESQCQLCHTPAVRAK